MMAYQAPGYVVAVINHNNQPVREFNENGVRVARVPFGTEYKLRLKNKTNRRCYAEIEIDGMKIDSQGRRLIMGAGQEIDVERFLDSLNKGNRFKFVSPTDSGVQDPTSADNGKVRVTFYPEMPSFTIRHDPTPWYGYPFWTRSYINNHVDSVYNPLDVKYGCATNAAASTSGILRGTSCNTQPQVQLDCQSVKGDAGATVGGSESSQKFTTSHESFVTEAPVVIEILMKGPSEERQSWSFNRNHYGQIDTVSFEGTMLRDAASVFTVTEPGGEFLLIKVPMAKITQCGSGTSAR